MKILKENSQIFTSLLCLLGLVVLGAPAAHADDAYESSQTSEPTRIELNLVSTCQVDDDCTVLLKVIKNSGLETFLQEEGPLTLLAPTDAAFAQMEEAEVKALMNPENTDAARTFIYRHLIPASLEEAQLLAEPQPIWEEGTVVFSKKDGTLTINGINVVRTAVPASNGQVYFISEVLPDQASDI